MICRRWVEIVDGIPDGKLFQIIPQTLRGLFRDPEYQARLERAGLTAGQPMKLEAISPASAAS